jgi:hypothetical protein
VGHLPSLVGSLFLALQEIIVLIDCVLPPQVIRFFLIVLPSDALHDLIIIRLVLALLRVVLFLLLHVLPFVLTLIIDDLPD